MGRGQLHCHHQSSALVLVLVIFVMVVFVMVIFVMVVFVMVVFVIAHCHNRHDIAPLWVTAAEALISSSAVV